MRSAIHNRQLMQICVIADNAQEIGDNWAKFLGRTPSPTNVFNDPSTNGVTTYMGKKTRELGLESITYDMAEDDISIQFEVLQAHNGPSEWEQFMSLRGRGIHHIAFSTEDWEPCFERVEKATGNIVVQQGYPFLFPDCYYAYFDTKKNIGTTLELLYYGESAKAAENARSTTARYSDLLTVREPAIDTKLPCAVTMVVRDIAQSNRDLAKILGLVEPSVIKVANGSVVVSGKSSEDAQWLKTIFDLKSTKLELIQPISGVSAWSEFSEVWQDGLYSVAFETSDIEKSRKRCEAFGLPLIQNGMMEDGITEYALFDGIEKLGAVIELRASERISVQMAKKKKIMKILNPNPIDNSRRFNERTLLRELKEDEHAAEVTERYIPGLLTMPGGGMGLRLPLGIAMRMESMVKNMGMTEEKFREFLDELNR